MLKIAGYEKFWAALVGGGMSTAATTLVLAGASVATRGVVPMPGPDLIAGALTGVVASIFSAMGAYLATNSGDALK